MSSNPFPDHPPPGQNALKPTWHMLPDVVKWVIWETYGIPHMQDERGVGPSSDRTVVESSTGMVGTSRATGIEKRKGRAKLNELEVHHRVRSAWVVEDSEKENEGLSMHVFFGVVVLTILICL